MTNSTPHTNDALRSNLWNDSEQSDSDSLSIATDDTADDLIGPGRTLGLIYNCAGRWVERKLNKLAEKMKIGPNATYEKIEKKRLLLLGESATSLQKVEIPKSEERRFTRHAKALLEYAKTTKRVKSSFLIIHADAYIQICIERHSNTISTQRAALEHIVALAIGDPYFRALFEVLDSPKILRQNCKELSKFEYDSTFDTTQLQSFSRKALIVVSEVDIGRVLSEMKVGFFLGPQAVQCYSRLINFLR